MTRLYVGLEHALLVIDPEHPAPLQPLLTDHTIQAIAADPLHPERVYVAAYDGLWVTTDAGSSWRDLSNTLPNPHAMALAVSALERCDDQGAVFLGTEPSAVYRSDDGGRVWREEGQSLTTLPSATTWSFPPRPDTHHVRWIGLDPVDAARRYICIEAGALAYSTDSGIHYRDRVPGGPLDTHTFAVHPQAPGRLYAASGEWRTPGYYESRDHGETWEQPVAGLLHPYLLGLAVDSADPDRVLVSAAANAIQGNRPAQAEAHVYLREGNAAWVEVAGLPTARSVCHILVAHPTRGGSFYALSNLGLFQTMDGGHAWEQVPLTWRDEFAAMQARALLVTA